LHRLGDEPTPGEPDRTSALRATLFEALGQLGADEAVRARAVALHRQSLEEPRSVDPDLLDAAVRVLAATGDSDTYDELVLRSSEATTPQDRLRYLGALADLPSEELIARLLDRLLSDEVRTQDAPFVLRRAITNKVGGARAWSFVRRNWEAINERFPSNSIARLLEGVRSLNDPAVAADVEAFLAEHPVPQGAKAVAQHLERMRVNVALRQREAGALHDALT